MRSKSSTLVLVGVLAAYASSMLALSHAVAQGDQRGLRLQASQGERRVALVIGNSAYKNSPLLNPVNDAQAMSQALRELGFEVIYGENISQNEMKRNIRAFGEKIRDGGVGLFYYAGHGTQINGRNFLIPINATITSQEEVEYESVDVGLLLAQMENARNRLNIVILDACRNNPFARSFRSPKEGLASIDAPSGTLIAYATAPGSVASDGTGKNGLYTQELLKRMRMADLNIEQVFKQVRVAVRDQTAGKQIPWESSSLVGDFYFSATERASSATNSKPLAFDPAAFELEFWNSIKNSTNADDFREYLAKYPNGTFAGLAKNKIRGLDTTPTKFTQTDPISGEWNATAQAAGSSFPFTLKLGLDGNMVTGSTDSPQGVSPITTGKWIANKLTFAVSTPNGTIYFSGSLREGKLVGSFDFAGQMTGSWEATKRK